MISGVGLIGGSIGLALHRLPNPPKVLGIGRDREKLKRAQDLGAIDAFGTTWQEVLTDNSLVVLCGPVSTIASQAMAAWNQRKGFSIILTDAGSTKQQILDQIAQDELLASSFVGGHPIAGSEKSGVSASRADLFDGRRCVITPSSLNSGSTISQVTEFWESLGCQVLEMTAEEHDQALAMTSHMPHVIAAILARSVPEQLHEISAGAFRDMTRIAGADAGMWHDIFLSNQKSLENALEMIAGEMLNFREMLAKKSSNELLEWWNEAKTKRLSLEHRNLEKGHASEQV